MSSVAELAALTVIDDTVLTATGAPPALGSYLVIRWPAFLNAGNEMVPTGSQSVKLAADGHFTVSLEPCDTSDPSFQYTCEYHLAGAEPETQAWFVPSTDGSLEIADVLVSDQIEPPVLGPIRLTEKADLLTSNGVENCVLHAPAEFAESTDYDGWLLSLTSERSCGLTWVAPPAAALAPTAKGELLVGNGTGPALLSPGTDGLVLLAQSSEPLGLAFGMVPASSLGIPADAQAALANLVAQPAPSKNVALGVNAFTSADAPNAINCVCIGYNAQVKVGLDGAPVNSVQLGEGSVGPNSFQWGSAVLFHKVPALGEKTFLHTSGYDPTDKFDRTVGNPAIFTDTVGNYLYFATASEIRQCLWSPMPPHPSCVLVGISAGTKLIAGATGDVCIGRNAGASLTTAVSVTAVGSNAAQYQMGSNCTFVGNVAGQGINGNANTGTYNCGFGTGSLSYINTGSFCVAMGSSALSLQSAGNHCVGLGYAAGQRSLASFNTYAGSQSGAGPTTGTWTGTHNSGFGYLALTLIDTGSRNTVGGSQAGAKLATNSDCTFFGYNAGAVATVDWAVGVGRSSLAALTTGPQCCAVGGSSFANITTSTGMTGLGYAVGSNQTSGDNCTYLGANSGQGNVSGSNNLCAGANAKLGTATSGAIQLGAGTNLSDNTLQVWNRKLFDSAGYLYLVKKTPSSGSDASIPPNSFFGDDSNLYFCTAAGVIRKVVTVAA